VLFPLIALALSLNVHAGRITAAEKRAFCDARLVPNGVQKLLYEKENHLTLYNRGGIANGGVCWWHSRFTRNAAYLAVFRPDQRRPSEKRIKNIIKTIRAGRQVEIPGYRDLQDFSWEHAKAIQNTLENWQLTDGLIGQQWVEGLRGGSETSVEGMKQQMDALYERVSAGEVVYQVLQLPGVVAHAWLVVGMQKTDRGYHLIVIDSNYGAGVNSWYYDEGMTSMSYSRYGNFVPQTHKVREEVALKRRLQNYCRRR
jgi:hypothetical protein